MVWFVLAFHRGGFLFLINEHHEINPWSGCTEFQFGLSCWFAVRMKISTECLFLGFLLLGCFNICDCLICYGSPYKVYTSYLLPWWSDFIMFVSTVLCLRFVNLPVLWSSYNRRKLFWSYDVSVHIAWLCSLHLRCIQPTVFLFYIKLAPVSASSIFLLQKISTSQPNTGW